jgi:TolB protein
VNRGTTALLLAVIVAGSAAAGTKAAQPPPAPAGPYDSAWPQYSPDGKSIVFASTREDDDFEIYVMGADGSGARRLTHAPGRDAHPIFSRDGKRILFQSPRAGPPGAGPEAVDLYVMNADGKHQRPLIAGPGFDGVPSLSKDGRTLAYMHGTPEGDALHWEIHVADSDGKHDRALTANPWSSQVPGFDPKGNRIVLHANPETLNQIFLLDLTTRAVSPLAEDANGVSEVPSFSPDGRYVAFTSTRDGPRDLYRVEVDTDKVTRLTTNMDVWSQAAWSPDGHRLVFSAKVHGRDEIFRIDSDGQGGPPVRLTHGAG